MYCSSSFGESRGTPFSFSLTAPQKCDTLPLPQMTGEDSSVFPSLPRSWAAFSIHQTANKKIAMNFRSQRFYGAGDEARTRYLHLGKVALYRMSYTRKWCLRPELNWRHADFQSAALPTELPRHIEASLKTRLNSCYGDPEQTRTVDLQRDRLAC